MQVIRYLTVAASVATACWTAVSAASVETTTPGIDTIDWIGAGCGNNEDAYPEPMSTTPYTVSSTGDFTTLHFSHFNLPPNDAVIIYAASMGNSSSADNPVSAFTYRGDKFSGSFFAATLPANIVNIELVTKEPADAFNASICKGFKIDKNFNTIMPANNAKSNLEEVCIADNSQEAACFGGESDKKVAMASVLRLVIKKSDGSYFCTGWLLGSDGHVVTNHHCIETAQQASDTEFEFNAYGANCQVNCKNPRGCGGTVFDRSKSVEFVTTNPDLDYTLVRLQGSWPTYLTMRESGAVLNEDIYIPQHPSGWGMRIAAKSDDGAPGSVTSLTTGGCAVDQVAYDLDTRAGSSGSPIISATDNTVVALHHCGGCPNTAVNGYKIINDLRAKGVLPRNAVYSPPTAAPATTQPPSITPAPTPKPTTQTPAPALAAQANVDGTIFATGSTTTVDYIDFTVSADADVELDMLSMEEVSNANGANSYADVNGDCNAGYIDSKIILFRLTGNAMQQSDVVAINTDAPDGYGAKDGSVSALDSYMFLRLAKGSYRLAVGTSAMSKADAVSKTNGAARLPRVCNAKVSNYGSYRLTVSATAAVQVNSPGSYIGSQCGVPNAVQIYAACSYHKEAALTQAAVVDGTIVRKSSIVTVDHIPFRVNAFGRVAIEVSSYGTADGVKYVDLNGHCVSAYIDPVVYLFRANAGGLQAADMINAGDDDESFAKRTGRHSINFRDPFFSLALPPGDYILTVGRYPLSVDDAIAKTGRSSVDRFTPESCGVVSANGNYIVTFGSAGPLPMTSPGTFSGSKCPPDTSKSICPH